MKPVRLPRAVLDVDILTGPSLLNFSLSGFQYDINRNLKRLGAEKQQKPEATSGAWDLHLSKVPVQGLL